MNKKIINKIEKAPKKVKFMKYFKRVIKKIAKNNKRKKKCSNPIKKKNLKQKDFKSGCLIPTPYNSNEFLMQNQSSPFYNEDEETDFNFISSELTNIDSEFQDFDSYLMESTNDDTNIINNLGNNIKINSNNSQKTIFINKQK